MAEASKYKKLTPIDHVLIRPEMYVGSVDTSSSSMFVFDHEKGRMVWESLKVNHGLLKIVDEILLNASDNIANKGGRMTYIRVHITEAGEITIENDGAGIPIVRSKEHKLYIPEMVFGHLLTSSNYDDTSQNAVAGRHGYGAKLTNILSHRFSVCCRTKGKEFHMSWHDHMRRATAPRVSNVDPKEKNLTRVKFLPDYERFGLDANKISHDMKRVLHKRIMDLAAMFPSIEISLNGVPFAFKSFADYAMLYSSPSSSGEMPPAPFVYESRNGAIAFIPSLTAGTRRIFGVVNGVVTHNGGTHCNAAQEVLQSSLESVEKALKKDNKVIDTNRVLRHFMILVFLVQVQPKFDSQNKARLVSVPTMPRVPRQELMDFLLRMPFLEAHVNTVTGQLADELNKEMGAGRRMSSKSLISSITKLVDATTTRRDPRFVRTLIVTEGDSAKALAQNSLSSDQKRYTGVFPLRGKLLNVRNKNLKRLKNCKELQELFCALGLELGKIYKDAEELRYQRLLVMTDQDADGSHIKGLVINAFEALWPSLLNRNPGFISIFSTPIVKVRLRDKSTHSFFSLKEFHKWQKTHGNVSYTAKYYKALGTSTTAEGKEYFKDMDKHTMRLVVERNDHKLLDSVFDSQEVEWRKDWMTKANAYTGEVDIDRSKKTLTVPDFVHKEMVHFALAGNARALAHAVDGLKPSQRKILWAIMRRSGNESAKVAQLSGYISEVSAFHHGEMSLQETIIKMAQNFTGGNNINLLIPEGQFGSRQQLGNDHAAARYIFTKLSSLARILFPSEDEPLLDYVTEEGQQVEPNHYVPILPLLLCNGSVGIGFGFASNIPPFHPLDVSAAVRSMINGEAAKVVVRRLVPWAVGYQGEVRRGPEGEFIAAGSYQYYVDGRVHVTEIPWTLSIEAFRDHISVLASKDVVQRIADYSGANHVDIDLELTNGAMTTYAECESELSLTQRIYINGTVFSPTGVLTPLEGDLAPVLQWHYDRRLDLYKKRRQRNLGLLEAELAREKSTLKFVTHFREGKIDIVNATDDSLAKTCSKLGMVRVDDSYDYVLRKPITFYTKTSLENLNRKISETEKRIDKLKKTAPVQMWLDELDRFDRAFEEHENTAVATILKERRVNPPTGDVSRNLQQPRLELEEVKVSSSGGKSVPMRVRVRKYVPPPPSKRPHVGQSVGGGGGGGSVRSSAAAVVAHVKAEKKAARARSMQKMLLDVVARQVARVLPRLPWFLF
uniref:DNA topoisomerase 2 n=1 Tax=Trypanosoma cruzi TaxID=5693 RepID=TOP2_TRYCR|nr:RecName: Full=DNA topoisomerase 2; AltName: Full=DNA topoisomerase II [Trypanosoma cruzi]AAA85575.1 DNA topoisomerase II [Trypanosoma cruzi]prf//1923363A DNA topoisomerase II [Trypanosoma cruzi]